MRETYVYLRQQGKKSIAETVFRIGRSPNYSIMLIIQLTDGLFNANQADFNCEPNQV
jgi:hypothetical protein